MGTHVFRWTAPADEVYVTGTFDNWSQSVQLEKGSGIFSKQVDISSATHDIYYKFVVDGKWKVDSTQPIQKDEKGNENNVLRKEDIEPIPAGGRSHGVTHPTPNPVSAIQSNVGPGATTAALAGAVPLEKNKGSSSQDHMPGTFPSDSPVKGTPSGVKDSPSAMEFFSPGDIVPDFSTYKSATLPTDSSKKDDRQKSSYPGEKAAAAGAGVTGAAAAVGAATAAGAKKTGDKLQEATGTSGSSEGEQKFQINPLPASSGTGNPVDLAPGEKVPPSKDYTSSTTTSNVKLDKESYEKSDAYPTSQNTNVNTAAGAFGVPPVTSNTIPESSLPMGGDKDVSNGPADVAAIRSAAGSNTTTGQLAGQVPLEPRGVPEVVRESQQEAHASPEAAANPTATAEKSATEQELKSKIPKEPATSDSSAVKSAATGLAAGGAAVATGAAAVAAGVPSSISNAFSSLRGNKQEQDPASEVPETVKESEKTAHMSPEAAAYPEAVREKTEVEKELTSRVPRTDASGEPAPPFSAATYTSAPQPQQGTEGGQSKDHHADVGHGKANEPKESSSLRGKVAALGAGATGAAAAVGSTAYAATQKTGENAKSAVQNATGTAPNQKIPTSGETAPTSTFAHDPTEAGSKHPSTEIGEEKIMNASAPGDGAKKAIPASGTTKSTSAFGADPEIADEGTAAAIAAMDTSAVKATEQVPNTVKDNPDTSAKTRADGATMDGTALASKKGEPDTEDAGGLNASKDQPAQSIATEAKKLANESEETKPPDAKPAQSETEEKKQDHGPLPGTTMLPTSAKNKPRQDSRDVSPMTKPEVTTGTENTTIASTSKGKGHARNESAMTTDSTADADGKKAKRRSFFGRIKDKLKHHE